MWTAFGIMSGFVCSLIFFKVTSSNIEGLNWRLMLGSGQFDPSLATTFACDLESSVRRRPSYRRLFFYRAVRSEGTRETAAYFGPRDLWPKLNLCSAIFLPECCTPLPCNKTRLRSHPVAFYSDSRSRTKSLQLDSLLLGQFSNNSSDSSNSPQIGRAHV